MIESTGQKAFVGVAWLMAAFTVGIALLVAFGMGEGEVLGTHVPRVVWAVVGVVAGAMILTGVRISNSSPIVGGTFVLAGALPLAFIMSWSVLAPLVWLALAAFLIAKVVQSVRNRGGPAMA